MLRAARAAFIAPGLADIEQASRVYDGKHRVILLRPVPQIRRASVTECRDQRGLIGAPYRLYPAGRSLWLSGKSDTLLWAE